MPPDLPDDQALMLKKRARRRLVGAIALVLLMIIVLPQLLQDRALLAQHEPITITMPVITSPANLESAAQIAAAVPSPNSSEPVEGNKVSEPLAPRQESFADKIDEISPVNEVVGESQPQSEASLTTEKKVAAIAPQERQAENLKSSKPQESFTVQVGVYSDVDNVKRLQDQLKQAGYNTFTEKVKTPKGDSLRLKAGKFGSRQDADAALVKIKGMGMSGIVIANE